MALDRTARRRVAGALAALALTAACSGGDDDGAGDADGGATTATAEAAAPLPDAYEGYSSELYAEDGSWLCRPGLEDDVCARDLDATVVNADGSTEAQPHEPADDPAVDCF